MEQVFYKDFLIAWSICLIVIKLEGNWILWKG